MPSKSSMVAMSKRHFDAGRMGNPNDRLRVDEVNINYFQIRKIGMSNDAIAAGMRDAPPVIEIRVVGNPQTDPGVALQMDATKKFEVSFDNAVTYQAIKLIETIKNTGTMWLFRAEL